MNPVRLPGCDCEPYQPAGYVWRHSSFCIQRPNQTLSQVELHTWRRAKVAREEAAAQADTSRHPASPAETWRPVLHDSAACEGVVCDSCDPVDDSGPYSDEVNYV